MRRVKVLEHLLEDNNISFDTERMAKECRIREQKEITNLKHALKKEQGKNRRVSNENTQSSMGIDAQSLLKTYRKETVVHRQESK